MGGDASEERGTNSVPYAQSFKNDLLARLLAHQFDDPYAALPFSARLARENGWTREFALRVIDEYRRFVYLACISSEEVTPSDEVDQVWHLHLTYSRDYWLKFCPEVLQRDLHHGPTVGGKFENDRYKANYSRTLDRYKAEFGEWPPIEIWPPAQIRFGYGVGNVRLNRKLFEINPKSNRRLLQKLFTFALAAALILMFFEAFHVLILIPIAIVAIYLGMIFYKFVQRNFLYNLTLKQKLFGYDVFYLVRPASVGDFASGKIIDIWVRKRKYISDDLSDQGHGCGAGCDGSGCSGCV